MTRSFAIFLLNNNGLVSPLAFTRNPVPQVINGSMWTIQQEFICYMGVAALGVLGLLRRRWTSLVLFVTLYTIYTLDQLVLKTASAQFIQLYMFFAAGAVVALYPTLSAHSRWALIGSVAILTAGAFQHPVFRLALPIAGSYLLFRFAFSPRIRFHDFARRGDISYGVYLYAFPIQQTLVLLRIRHPFLLFVLAYPLSLIFARLSWRFVDAPFLRLKSTRPDRGLDVAGQWTRGRVRRTTHECSKCLGRGLDHLRRSSSSARRSVEAKGTSAPSSSRDIPSISLTRRRIPRRAMPQPDDRSAGSHT